ncbi:hypothetical protein B1759_17165 [Rubrivirga sp. SAORIC476]|nr:hypothetical protein B1759_17165 [Rubrivirga sp. SAORIC476]
MLASVAAPVHPLLSLLVVATAFGLGVAVYLRTGTAWGWASHRLYDRAREPAAFRRNVIGLIVPLVGVVLLMLWFLVRG